jgi:two-component system, response regulator PdtaR
MQAGKPARILVIEDDLLIATQIETTLTEAGFDVVGLAPTGEEAIELAANDPPDLAVVDIRLAGDRNGVDTALELFRSHGIRCIFASAYSDDESRRRAAPAAPFGWLQKPYSMASLTEMVRKAADEVRAKGRR